MALTGLGGCGAGASPQALNRKEDKSTAPIAVLDDNCVFGAEFIVLPILN
jgi:hypothetical protein